MSVVTRGPSLWAILRCASLSIKSAICLPAINCRAPSINEVDVILSRSPRLLGMKCALICWMNLVRPGMTRDVEAYDLVAKEGSSDDCSAEGKCYSKEEDWWTYEVCVRRSVRQFHLGSGRITSEFHLGDYEVGDVFIKVRGLLEGALYDFSGEFILPCVCKKHAAVQDL